MYRRELLASLVLSSIAGCSTTNGDAVNPTHSSKEPSEETTMTDDETTAIVESVKFTLLDSTPGSKQQSASIEQSDSKITVTGTIWAANSCMTASVDEVVYDNTQSRLTITIETVERADTETCAQSFIEVDYELLIELSDIELESILVNHKTRDGEKLVSQSP